MRAKMTAMNSTTDDATHEIETIYGTQQIESVGCDGCANQNVRISTEGIAYERNRHGTWVRHGCDGY